MNKILENKFGIKSSIIRQFIIYGTVALIPTTVDFSLLYLLTEFAGFHYLSSLVFAFIVALFFSYFFQKKFTFKNGCQKYAPQFSVFCLVSFVGLLINAGIVFSVVEVFGLWYMFGKVIATGVSFIWNFSAHKCITFQRFR